MKIRQILKSSLLFFYFLSAFIMVGCSSDDDTTEAIVKVNGTALVSNDDDFFGDINGDFTGSGGSVARTFTWANSLSTADYNADITATTSGVFRMVVKDSDGKTVLDRSLNGATEPDSFSGVTSAGSPGIWSVTITLTSFNGDGSFSLSEGD
ncbi:hypothetical protein ACXYMT_01540 [Salinimicrobium sp. CAU 1759]